MPIISGQTRLVLDLLTDIDDNLTVVKKINK